MNLFDIFATLTLETDEYDDGLEKSEAKAKGFGAQLEYALGKGAKIGAAGLAALGTGAAVASGAFVKGMGDVASYGDHIDKMSQKLHMSAESYQEWDFIMQHTGASIDSMGMSMKTLTGKLSEGSEAFAQLGLSQEALAGMSQEEAFAATIEALQGVEDETQRTVLAQELLGRGATELGPLLNMSAEDTAAMKQQVHELGGVMSDEAVKAGAQFKDSMTNLKTVLSGVKNNMMSQFLPAASKVMDGLTAIFAGDSSGIAVMEEGLREFGDKLMELVPMMMEVGTSILTTLIETILANFPMLIETAVNLITTFVEKMTAPDMLDTVVQGITQVMNSLIGGITKILPQLIPAVIQIITTIAMALIEPNNLKMIIECAVEIVTSIATGIAQNLDELIPAVLDAILTIVGALIDPKNLMDLIEAAWSVVKAIGHGIAQALGFNTFVNAVADIFNKIWEGVKNVVDAAWQWGKDMISNFVDGMKSAASLCEDGIAFYADMIDDYLGHSTPDKGPLKDDDMWGADFVDNWINGMKSKKYELEGVISGTAEYISGDFEDMPTGASNAYGAAGAGTGQIVIPVYIGNEKIDELVVNSNQHVNFISGGRG